MTLFKITRSHRLKYRVPRSFLASLFIFIWVCAPVVPVIQLPTKDESMKLGLKVARTHADPFGNGYEYRRSITINESQVTGSGDLTNFPVLISFTDPTFRTTGNGGNVTDAQGDDIIFTSDASGSTVLDFEVERYTGTTGEIIAWVEVPTLDFNDNTVIYMFYNNASVTTSQEDIPGTWDGNYIGVYHMDGTSSFQLDSASSSVRHDGTVSGATASAAGKIGPAYDFDGTNDVITVTDQAELDLTNTGTFEAWMRTDDVNTSESNFSTWVSRAAPNGAGADDQSGMDAVIVGENIYFGAYLCTNGTEDFAVASTSLAGNRFDNWDLTKMTQPTGDCGVTATAGQEGAQLGVDSDGVHIYFGALSANNATGNFETATATISFSSVSTWRDEANPTGAGAAEGNGTDLVIVGGTAYYSNVLLTGTTETVGTTSRAIGSGAAMTWQNTGVNFGAAANENCSISSDSDGQILYRTVLCGDGVDPEENYWSASTTVGSAAPLTWRNEADPVGAGLADFNNIDLVAMGGHLYHVAALHNDATEVFTTASSSMTSGGTLTWTSRQDGSSNPNGSAATDALDVAVTSDGKNLYYAAFIASATEAFYTASSTLSAHPFISKRNAYEAIQVGRGFAFDWVGRPYTFGTSTDTTGFRHVVVTQDGTTLSMYENGVLSRTQTTSVDFESNANNLLIGGGNRSDGTSIWFNGIIDEVRVSNTARSADWIQTQYNNQNATSTFYTLGSEETNSTAPTVTTNFASNVGATSATLHGSITSNGGADATQHGFAYSTNSTLSSGVSTTTLGGYTGAGTFSGGIVSLSPDTTYYFRAYATNTGGTGFGAILSFFTGNANVTRNFLLFGGATLKLLNGKAILHQR